MRGTWILLLLCWAPLAAAHGPAAASTGPMLKCRDARGQITYSNVPCDKQGLQEVGPVADRTTVMPLGPLAKPPASSAKEAAKDAPKKDEPVKPQTEPLKK
jgi:hypothetical protein